jgi:hypothetical protein
MCRRLSPITQRIGFVLSPVHFYFPIPDTRDMDRRRVWDHRTSLAGIHWNREGQLAFLTAIGRFSGECSWPRLEESSPGEYGWDAPTFGYSSAMFAHSIVRHIKPRRVIEVGCGWSTRVLSAAMRRNRENDGVEGTLLGIDPYPPEGLALEPGEGQLERRPVQEIAVDRFEEMKSGDVLFIDSSHVLNTGSDVAYLYLEVLPRIAPGVVIHVHDIQIPYEYPREYAVRQRWFWTEQYLLQSFLQFNEQFEILLAGHWICRDEPEAVQEAFPGYDPSVHSPTGSFWMRRRG